MHCKRHIIVPEGVIEVLLHACCAPCSSAIVEWLMQHDIRPALGFDGIFHRVLGITLT